MPCFVSDLTAAIVEETVHSVELPQIPCPGFPFRDLGECTEELWLYSCLPSYCTQLLSEFQATHVRFYELGVQTIYTNLS
jgi:hypothetical protein